MTDRFLEGILRDRPYRSPRERRRANSMRIAGISTAVCFLIATVIGIANRPKPGLEHLESPEINRPGHDNEGSGESEENIERNRAPYSYENLG